MQWAEGWVLCPSTFAFFMFTPYMYVWGSGDVDECARYPSLSRFGVCTLAASFPPLKSIRTKFKMYSTVSIVFVFLLHPACQSRVRMFACGAETFIALEGLLQMSERTKPGTCISKA